MKSSDFTIDWQLKITQSLVAECDSFREQLTQMHIELREITDVHHEDQSRIRIQYDGALQTQLQQFQTQTANDLSTLSLDVETQSRSLTETQEQTAQRIASKLNADIKELEERRQSETWILQSVLDEESNDSPIQSFDREAETYVTQKAILDERFALVEKKIHETEVFLATCHTVIDSEKRPPADLRADRNTLRDMAVEATDFIEVETDQIRRLYLPQWIRGFRIWGFSMMAFLLIWILVTGIKADLRSFVTPEIGAPDWEWAGVASLIAFSIVLLSSLTIFYQAQSQLRSRFEPVLQRFADAKHAQQLWERKCEKNIDRLETASQHWRSEIEQRRTEQTRRIHTEIDSRIQSLNAEAETKQIQLKLDHQNRIQELYNRKEHSEARIRDQLTLHCQQAHDRHQNDIALALAECDERFQQASHQLQRSMSTLLTSWSDANQQLRSIAQQATSLAAATRQWPPSDDSKTWVLPSDMPNCLSVGDILITAPKAPAETADTRTSSSLCIEMPAILRFPQDTSVLVEHDSAGRESAIEFLRIQILKLLTVIPAGRIRLTLIDPVGLGQSFSALMHLTDFDELLIHNRIWTESTQIRDQLQKVTEHMENIFQTYLRSQFDTIEEYNVSAGEVAEPYHFVVVAGFPAAFSEESGRHLASILTSGPRCGVHALIAWNPGLGVPQSFDTDDLINHCIRFHVDDGHVQPHQKLTNEIQFEQASPLSAQRYVQLVRDVGEQSKDARRVEVSFNRVSPKTEEIWTHSTANGIDLPIGRAGAARLQYMRLGRGTSQHVLIAGKTGSGKSTFLHILITNLALHYSPDEIQFYLIDFKKGVEFRTYAANRLPHARVVAIESDREFGLSVLERLDEILQERGELFRDQGVQDVPSFREKFPKEAMPRLLLLIDEFQEFFTAEDRVSARASLLLDRLVRQGRAFGIHILLGSQTLGGAYSLARSTMGQIAVRIALQCSENDAHLILSEDNTAARMLTRPGEAIYNDANGLTQGNHPFQIAWLEEAQREIAIATMLSNSTLPDRKEYGMVVFEGNVPPKIELCAPLNARLRQTTDATRKATDAVPIWLGEPVAISAPTAIELRRASGQNILIVGQDESQLDCLLACVLLSTAAPPKISASPNARLTVLHDGRDTDSVARMKDLSQLLGDSIEIQPASACDAVIASMHEEIISREENPDLSSGPERILIVRNLGQFRTLRRDEDEFGLGSFGQTKEASTATMFSDIVKRGSLVGVHVLVWSDTYSNAMRWLSNSLLREFENRIVFRLNQTDSASLIDNPAAANLGPGRAILYRDQTGAMEKFRPFAWPSQQWLNSVIDAPTQLENGFDIDTLTIE